MGNTFITNTILKNLIDFLAPVVGIALVVFCVVQAFHIFKGSEGSSFKKLLSGVGVLLLILGIMYAAGSFDTYGKSFKNLTNSVITSGAGNATKIVGGKGE